ncbi:MAG: M1 family metallopeptidase [Bacteroidetes bacterium]|nr:M1 family metallopeptidase [Bacteroidota bacterium]
MSKLANEQMKYKSNAKRSIKKSWKQVLPIFLCIQYSIFNLQPSFAQSLTDQKKEYTRADSLRGGLRHERTCYDVTFYDLKVKIDTATQSVSGTNRIVFKAIDDFKTMQIDLFDNMNIVSIKQNGESVKYRREFNAVFVDLNDFMKRGLNGEIEVRYNGKPIIAKRAPWDGGFTWTHDKNGKPWIAVACEGMGASCWWPCKDYLGDEPDSMSIWCNVPDGLRCISNGNEMESREEIDTTTSFHWFVHYPINNYNVTLNIGDYVQFSEEYIADDNSKLALDYYVMRYNLDKAKLQFTQVKPMLKCYEKYLGKYPFWKDGYALVETPYLGMEHQGAIAYGNRYLTGYAGNDYSGIGLDFDYIIIHESAHEWWGNSVSCKDIADMWIHESFATYTESIYVECMLGHDTAIQYINKKKKHMGNEKPVAGVYGVNEEGDGDMYSKGALFINTLRSIVNDDEKWWSIIKGMCDTSFKMKNVSYENVAMYFCRKTGKDLLPVFEQYLKFPKIPVFEYKLKKLKKGEFELSYRWAVNAKDFRMPAFVFTIENSKQMLKGTNEFQTTTVKLKKETDFKVNEDLMYIEVKKL